MKRRTVSFLLALSVSLTLIVSATAADNVSGVETAEEILHYLECEKGRISASISEFAEMENTVNSFSDIITTRANEVNEMDIQPRSTVEHVKYYQYRLEAYNGDITYKAWVYKDIVVPNGKELVCTNTQKIVSVEYDAYYNNVKYKTVTRIECEYELR